MVSTNESLLILICFPRTYAAQLSSYRSHCDSILHEVEAALHHLQDLQQKHLLVSTKTGALHEACEQLLQDQVWQNDDQLEWSDIFVKFFFH